MGHWIWMGIIGLLAGALAKFVLPGKDGGGIIITMLLGIAGALLMTLLGKAVGWYDPGDSAGFIGAFLGSVILLLGYRQIKKK
ncbi:MAG: GlsB/YeaQ/YmgE family stress response membrane protein [Candidatus Kapaibacterium sp.]